MRYSDGEGLDGVDESDADFSAVEITKCSQAMQIRQDETIIT